MYCNNALLLAKHTEHWLLTHKRYTYIHVRNIYIIYSLSFKQSEKYQTEHTILRSENRDYDEIQADRLSILELNITDIQPC